MKGALGLPKPIGRSLQGAELLVILALTALALLTVHLERSKKAGETLQMMIGRLPRGITAAEAERRLGNADEIELISGVLHNNTMLAAENSKAAMYGTSQPYSVHLWRRGSIRAAVYVDGDGRVAGRKVWNRRRELHGGFFDSLGLAD